MGKLTKFLGPVGNGARMKLVLNQVMGSMMAAFSEGMSLAAETGLQQPDLIELLGAGAMAAPLFALKGPNIIKDEHPPNFPLKHMQKDLRLALAMGDAVAQPMPVAAAANELFKKARSLGYGDADFAAVHNAVKK